MHTADMDPEALGDIGAGSNLMQLLFTNWVKEAVRKTLEKTGIIGMQRDPDLWKRVTKNSFGGDSFERESSDAEDQKCRDGQRS